DPFRDTRALLEHVVANAAELGVDPSRVGVWSCSGNVPNAFALIRESPRLACAALCYGYVTDEDGFDEVARAAAQYGFVNPVLTRSNPLRDIPLLIVRAGRDEMPGLNASLDRFITRALARNERVTVVNHADGPHAFDVLDDTDPSRAVIRQVLSFFENHLLERPG